MEKSLGLQTRVGTRPTHTMTTQTMPGPRHVCCLTVLMSSKSQNGRSVLSTVGHALSSVVCHFCCKNDTRGEQSVSILIVIIRI